MSYVEISKQIMMGEKIYNIPLRVCFYARVSTDSDVQLNSLENQYNYYEDYIKSKQNWKYVGGYVDEGISGVRVDKREGFKKMIEDAKNGMFDLIITKEVSRFARDLEDSIHYIRILKDNDVGVYFENQNLDTFDANSELILNIMFNLAQDESRKLSARVKFGHKEAIKKGHVLGANITGYKKNNCKLVVVEKEAEFIRKIFELYATGKYGFYKLGKTLSELGYYNKKGNLYDKETLKRIITNPKYKGYYRGGTTETIDYRTKKRMKIDKKDQVLYKCDESIIPAIVSEKLWDRANEILNSRTAAYNEENNFFTGGLKYPFSSKIYCGEHNTRFQRSHGRRKKNRPIWACGLYLQYRITACSSPIIAEGDLYNIVNDIIEDIIPDKEIIINDMLELYKNIEETDNYDAKLKRINDDIKRVEDRKTFALDLVYSGEISRLDLKKQFEMFEAELTNLGNERIEIEKQKQILSQNSDSVKRLSKFIEEELNGGSYEEFIRNFVDEIIVNKIDNDRHNIKLDIYLNLFEFDKIKRNGAYHINGATENDMLYTKDKQYKSIENLRKDRITNNYIYNVYVETL